MEDISFRGDGGFILVDEIFFFLVENSIFRNLSLIPMEEFNDGRTEEGFSGIKCITYSY